MSFFVLPPEINSLRMFVGAGSAPMLEAAAAWSGLADELGTAAQSFASVTSGLSRPGLAGSGGGGHVGCSGALFGMVERGVGPRRRGGRRRLRR